MASESGTASSLEDLFSKIITFLTTDADLVADSQEWQTLRLYRDNIDTVTTNLTENTTDTGRRVVHTFRYDPRSIGSNTTDDDTEGSLTCSNYSQGTSQITIKLRVSKTIATVRLRAPNSSTGAGSMLQNFRLQYSDDGSSWTTALTVNSNPAYNLHETKDFAVGGSPGSHLWWKIIIDRKVGGATTGSVYWKTLLLLDGSGAPCNHFGSEAILKATGLAGTDSIYTGIRSEYDASRGWYNLFLNGYSGYNSSEASWFKQPGAIPGYGSTPYVLDIPMVPLWDSTMSYWFRATGRMFSFSVKVSTSYEGGYLGFILPYSTPAQYPYPLAVGGSLVPFQSSRSTEWRYSSTNQRHSTFPIPGCDTSNANSNPEDSGLYLRLPDGTWQGFGQRESTTITQYAISLAPPYSISGLRAGVWPTCHLEEGSTGHRRSYREILGGGYMMQPLVLTQRLPYVSVWGQLDGCYAISGFGNSSENTTTWSGDTYVVFQNTTRTSVWEYWALVQD